MDLYGAISALVTPMYEDGQIDYPSLDKLVEYQLTNGIKGLVVAGSTGEATTLTRNEKLTLTKHVIKKVNGQAKIIVGVGDNSTHNALEFISELNQIPGLDYIMVTCPCYVKPTQEGLYEHFTLLAAASKAPIIIYNIPGRTATDMKCDTVLKLAHGNSKIVGLKDSTADLSRVCYLNKNKPATFGLYSGDDATSLPFILSGGNGAISVVSNLVPKQYSQMANAAVAGDKQLAIKLNNAILDLHSMLFCASNPIPLKWALYKRGAIATPHLRLPLTTLSVNYQNQLQLILDNIFKDN
jgi:4-hydroxy-tetrahydrodipicolinate synthase